jgi:dipeptidyl aminopeptidase/acylaminoacyl peptidase
MKGLRPALWVAAALAAAAAMFAVAKSARLGASFIHPRRFRVSAEQTRKAFADIASLQEVTLKTSDGLALRAWFSPGVRRAAVIFVHGLWGNRAFLEPEAAVISRHGYGVLLFDSRAEGDSEGTVATWGDREQRDVTAALDYVSSRPEIDPTRIGLLGFSVGGSTVAMASALDHRVSAVVLYATWPSLADEMRANHAELGALSWGPIVATMRLAGVDFSSVRPIDHVAEISPRPLLMIAGGQDEDTPVPVMRRVFDAAREPKQLWIVAEAHHGGVYQARPEEYEKRVIAFLDGSIGKGSEVP